jgi:hypothetical protein
MVAMEDIMDKLPAFDSHATELASQHLVWESIKGNN